MPSKVLTVECKGGVTERTHGRGQNTTNEWTPPSPWGPPVLGLPFLPPGNYSSQCEILVKRKGIIYSKSYTDLE